MLVTKVIMLVIPPLTHLRRHQEGHCTHEMASWKDLASRAYGRVERRSTEVDELSTDPHPPRHTHPHPPHSPGAAPRPLTPPSAGPESRDVNGQVCGAI